MSSPKYRLVLSPHAKQDIIDILRYTGGKWGRDQVPVYRDKLNTALRTIGQNPNLGHRSDELPGTHRCYPAGSHVIVYRMEEQFVGVVRVLHGRMSLPRNV